MSFIRHAPAPLALALLAACAQTPDAPRSAPAAPADGLAALPSGGCWDGPLAADVNGAPHTLTRTGERTFVASGPVFSALEITLATDGEATFIRTARGFRRLAGDPASCTAAGEGNVSRGARALPLAIAIAPAEG